MTNQAFEVLEKVKKVILTKPINGLLSFIEFGPIYRSYLENGRRFAHIRWIPVFTLTFIFNTNDAQLQFGCIVYKVVAIGIR